MATGALVAVAGGGLAMQAYGQYKQSEADAEAMDSQADAADLEANELLRRADINAEGGKREGEDIKAGQLSSYIASGVDISEGTPLDVLEDTNEKVMRQIEYDLETASFQAEQARRGAEFTREAADNTATAGKIAAAGTIISGAASIAAGGA